MDELRDLVEEVEKQLQKAREAISKERQVTSDRDLETARGYIAAALRVIDRGRQAGVVPKW